SHSPPPPSPEFIALLELLSSALADVNAQTVGTRDARSRAEYDLIAARARLAMMSGNNIILQPLPGTPAPIYFHDLGNLSSNIPNSSASSSSPSPAPPLPTSFSNTDLDRDLASLLVENTQLTLLKLRPPFLPKVPTTNVTPLPADPLLTPLTDNSPISKLPAEILGEIIRLARIAAEKRLDEAHLPGGVSHSHGDPYDVRPARMRKNAWAERELLGSRTAAQRFVHSLALVNKTWQATSRSIAYASIHLRKKTQLPKLLEVLLKGGCRWAEHIVAVNVKLPVTAPDPSVVGSIRSARGGGLARHMTAAYTWAQGSTQGSNSSSSQRIQDDTEPSTIQFSRLVAKAANLQTLTLTVIGFAYSAPFGSRHQSTDFLDPAILATLSSISSLTSLTLGTSVDFEELEVILAGLPSLAELYLEGGFDDVNGRGVVTSSTNHSARLKTLVVGNPQTSYRDFTSITDGQLAWLLEPAVGSLKVLDLTIMSNGGVGMGGWPIAGAGGGAGGPVLPPCFASGLFADLLVRMGGTIERLSVQASPSLSQAPHSGNFDFALSNCTRLHELTLQFQYTGTALLDSLLPSSATLESLHFMGTPTSLPADDLAERIELGVQFRVLKKLVVHGQYAGRGPAGAGWSGPQVRRLKNVTKEKGVGCVLVT
ncbi:hypothetical protein P7C70_g5946, partial [Phenoliferia sp. Uapishka_3]